MIHKYELYTSMSQQTVEMPRSAKILKIKGHTPSGGNPKIFMWVEVNGIIIDTELRTFEINPTGQKFRNLEKDGLKREYIDTVFQLGISLVWHIFEIRNKQ